jgi:hypothetical protein
MIYDNENLSLSSLCFFRPLGSRLFRVVGLPDVGNMCTELDQVLNTLCILKRRGVWYFKYEGQETIELIGSVMLEMDIPHFFIQPDEAWCN